MALADCGFKDDPAASGSSKLLQLGPTIFIDVGFDSTYVSGSGNWNPSVIETSVPGLIDTGATVSCIDDRLAKKLNLPVVDVQKFGGSSGGHDHNMYACQIRFPALDDFMQIGLFAGVHLEDGGQVHRALIGRSLLARTTMIYNGLTGEVTLEQTPSSAAALPPVT